MILLVWLRSTVYGVGRSCIWTGELLVCIWRLLSWKNIRLTTGRHLYSFYVYSVKCPRISFFQPLHKYVYAPITMILLMTVNVILLPELFQSYDIHPTTLSIQNYWKTFNSLKYIEKLSSHQKEVEVTFHIRISKEYIIYIDWLINWF